MIIYFYGPNVGPSSLGPQQKTLLITNMAVAYRCARGRDYDRGTTSYHCNDYEGKSKAHDVQSNPKS